MLIVITDNNAENLAQMETCVRTVFPDAEIHGFVDGNKALAWCLQAGRIDLFFGHYWDVDDDAPTMEAALILQKIEQKPRYTVFFAGDTRFAQDAEMDNGDAFFVRPATVEKIRKSVKNMPKMACTSESGIKSGKGFFRRLFGTRP